MDNQKEKTGDAARKRPSRTRSRNNQSQNRSRGHGRPGAPGVKKTTKKTTKKRSRNGGGRRNNRRRSMTNPALTHRMAQKDDRAVVLPEVTDENTVRVIPMSGVEQIGRNMTIVETKDDIIVFDIGFEFVSPEKNAPGINYILPNTQYLEERKHKIRALVILSLIHI